MIVDDVVGRRVMQQQQQQQHAGPTTVDQPRSDPSRPERRRRHVLILRIRSVFRAVMNAFTRTGELCARRLRSADRKVHPVTLHY